MKIIDNQYIDNVIFGKGYVEKLYHGYKLIWANNRKRTIFYISTDGRIVNPRTDWGNVRIESNTYENGVGRIIFDKEIDHIHYNAFQNCKTLKEIYIPLSVTAIYDDAFYECTSLDTVHFNEGLVSIGNHAFYHDALKNLDLPSTLESIGEGCFRWNMNITDVVIPDNVTVIKKEAFYECEKLRSVAFSNNLREIGSNAFYHDTELTEIVIPNSVTTMSDGCFARCTSLSSVTLSQNLVSIESSCFELCSKLVDIVIPNNVQQIMSKAFRACIALPSIIIPENVRFIADKAFESCRALSEMTLPMSLERMGSLVFNDCQVLTNLTSLNTYAPVVFDDTFSGMTTPGTLHYPSGKDYSSWLSRLPEGWTGQEI